MSVRADLSRFGHRGPSVTLASNHDVYSTVEFEQWVSREALLPEEQLMIERFLPKSGPTVEAGTGGGRIVLAAKALGYKDLHAFDFVPQFVAECRKKVPDNSIDFRTGDARKLTYPTAFFSGAIYLQQLLCLLERPGDRLDALQELHRVLKPGGQAVFSFLSWEARSASPMYQVILTHLRALRLLTLSTRESQVLPWLRLGNKFNWNSLLDHGPYVYWFRTPEAAALLEQSGFRIDGIATTKQLLEGRALNSAAELAREPHRGNLFIACTRV